MISKSNKVLIQLLNKLLSDAIMLGVQDECKFIVDEYLGYHEFGLAFDQIVYELHENNIRITNDFYRDFKKVADLMKLDEDEYRPRLEGLVLN